MSYRIGIDIGGTFTDFVLYDNSAEPANAVSIHKELSTPDDNSIGVMNGLEQLAKKAGQSLEVFLGETEAVIHGTTVADNALIEGKGATVGLLTTEGFRDEIELRRGYKEDIWDVRLEPPKAIVPRRRRLTVKERMSAGGEIVAPLDETAAREAIKRLAKQEVDSVAIVTLFSFVNPVHEQRLAELVLEEMPNVALSLSHLIMPKAPEFERASTTIVNAFVNPRVTGYLDKLVDRLRAAGYEHELLAMQCSGGVMSREFIRQKPIVVLASGPAGGVMGGAELGKSKGANNLLCVDMGGTSYDVSVVKNGIAPAEPGWNWHHRYLVGLPMVSVVTVGAGGGSIASVKSGMLQVGPESAGSDPGPVCYGNGGTRPTVTDANLVLGLLSDESEFAGGSFSLSRKGVNEAFQEHVAGPMGCSVEEAAFDVWRVVNANMTQAVRRVTAEKGTRTTELTMLAYGGNGPVFAGVQAKELGINRILVPRTSATFSASGVLSADLLIDEEKSYMRSAGKADAGDLATLWQSLADSATGYFVGADVNSNKIQYSFFLNLRYPGQNWSLSVAVTDQKGGADTSFVTAEKLAAVVESFHAQHEAEYSYARNEEQPEITGVRLITRALSPKPPLGKGEISAQRGQKAKKSRRANLGEGFAETPIFSGPDLQPGDMINGPAIIEEVFTTIVVYPGWKAVLDDAGDYVLINT
ncbi:MAG: N-methylhydantoinase A [Paracoccaceae bacterium]|jgi:N-methylhydantoinase A